MNTVVVDGVLLPGFADPVFAAQRVFRAALEAFSHPGRRVSVGTPMRAPGALAPATAAFLLAMADFETPLWLQSRDPALVDYLRFHCGAAVTGDLSAARFAVITDPFSMPPLDAFYPGEPEYPDRSATLLVQVAGIHGMPSVTLRGPGIEGSTRLHVAGLPDDFWTQWARNDALFPCGVDVVFTHGDELCALPRTTQAEAQCTSL